MSAELTGDRRASGRSAHSEALAAAAVAAAVAAVAAAAAALPPPMAAATQIEQSRAGLIAATLSREI